MASQNATSNSTDSAVTIFRETQPYFLYLIASVLEFSLAGEHALTSFVGSVRCFVLWSALIRAWLTINQRLYLGVYTLVFGIYVYLQVQQRNRLHYHHIALLLLYLLGTGAVVVGILDYREWSEWLLSTVLSNHMTAPSAVAHYKSLVDLEWVFFFVHANWL